MKRYLIFILMLLFAGMLLAQNTAKEAQDALDSAKSHIQKGEYGKAQDELNYAQNLLGELLATALLQYIPETPKGFSFIKKEASSLGQGGALFGSANASVAKGSYSQGNASFEISISQGGVLGQAGGLMSGLASLLGGMNDAGFRQIRVKGYSGSLEYDEEMQSGWITFSVGNKLTVTVSGEDLENSDQLKDLAEQIDFAALEKAK